MSQKFRLVEDNDSPKATIRRYLGVVSWLVIGPIAALVILSAICVASAWAH